jgi:(p)ppGpp synthase/HD superfamily hydrolase
MNDVLLLARAIDFAARRHAGQRRKGAAAEPYVNHLAEVALLLAEATGGADPRLVAAGLLHDAIEDTGATEAELAAAFGRDVAKLVAEVTDNKSLPKAERKRLQVANAAKKPRRAKMLKLADKTSNLRSLAASPPVDWPTARRRGGVGVARAVAAGLAGAHPLLEVAFAEAAAAADAALSGAPA